MTPRDAKVTVNVRSCDSNEYPLTPGFTEFAILIRWLAKHGVLEEIKNRFQLNRLTGYVGIDLMLVLLGYLCASDKSMGIRGFCEETRAKYGKCYSRVAALAGRNSWPTQASVSRMYNAIEAEESYEFIMWLLTESGDARALWQHDSAVDRDCLGKAWHVFSYDPTISTLRRRCLPKEDNLPEARRRAAGFAKPGYPGRKRGEIQISRGTLQHRGTGLFHMITMTSGNADIGEDLNKVVVHLRNWAPRVDVSIDHCIVVVDGEGGGWSQVKTLAPSGVQYVTRLTYYLWLSSVLREENTGLFIVV